MPADQLGFVLHLGDFIYEVVEYPDELPTRYDRTIYEVGRIPDGGQTGKLHYPLTVDGYRVVYKGYLADPDLQEARARWPFVAIWDNHEFSWQGRQSIVQGRGRSATGPDGQSRRQSGMVRIYSRAREGAERIAGHVRRAGREKCADRKVGGQWPRDRTQQSDRHQLCGDDPADAEGVGKIYDPTFNGMFSEPAMIALDAGRTYNGGKPPAELTFGDISIPNPRKDSPPRTILGSRQKQWFMDQLSEHDTGTLDSFLSLTPRVTLSGRPK